MALKHVPYLFGLAVLAGWLSGCSKSKPEKETAKADLNVPVQATSFPNHKAGSSGPSGAANRLQQPFLEAVTLDPPSEEQLLPPEKTAAGMSVGKLFEIIAGHNGIGGMWDRVVLTNPDGKVKAFTANVDTDLGKITIELWPEVAPNHVRNFICLAKVGYYDGLGFDGAWRQPGPRNSFVGNIIAGCPLGTGEPGYGSIGYWLKPEFSDKHHEPGTVGACRDGALESASTKFYISLSEMQAMDGYWTVFGKVTQGLDVARTIFHRPVDEEFFLKDRVLIRQVTIQEH